jgi:hypothetical protein
MSEIRTNLLSNAAGTGPATLHKQSAAKVWVAALYTSGVPAIQASFNVSSLTDVGLGVLGVNFASAMASSNYAVAVANQNATANNRTNAYSPASASSFQAFHFVSDGTLIDPTRSSGNAYGDLA